MLHRFYLTTVVQKLIPVAVRHAELSLTSERCYTVSFGRGLSLNTGRALSHPVWWLQAGGSPARHVRAGPLSGRNIITEELWREFFSDPSQWWDHRSEKINPRYPDFKHKKTQKSLWLKSENNLTPLWVEAKLTELERGTLQLNIFSWNTRLQRFVKAGQYTKTLELFQQMQREGIIPNKFTFPPVLNACSNSRSLEEGRHVHEEIIRRGLESDVYVGSSLIDMYAKCGSIEDAWSAFNRLQAHNVVTWSTMIAGYAKAGQGLKAMELFRRMQQEGVEPNAITFVGVLNACASLAALEQGRCIHDQIIQSGCESDVYISSCLVDMYAKCGSIDDAWNVFNKMPRHNVVTWNAMIGGYAKSGQETKAMKLFRRMQQEGMEPDAVTFVGVLKACASVVAIEEGRRVHEEIIQKGCESDVYVGSCLVDMYAKCGSTEDAWSVFNKMGEHNVVTWNAMIGGYVKSGQGLKVLELFQKMQQERVEPDSVTFIKVLSACATLVALDEGRRVHEQIIRLGCESDVYVGSCLIDMYSKCGSIEDAWSVFTKMPDHDVVTWNAIIGAYATAGEGLKAIELFRTMQQEGMDPDVITFVEVLNVCGSFVALEEGRRVHGQIIERGFESHVYVGSCLIDMYSKCGSILNARTVFDKMQDQDVVSWSAMIGGYAMSGHGLKAVELFQRMQQAGVEPDTVTFVRVLNACSSVAALEAGRCVHEQIIQRGCESDLYVGSCLVDMYAKCGSTGDAWSVFNKMPVHNVVTWNAMIGGYVKSGQVLKAMELFRKMQQEGVEPNAITFVVVLSACCSTASLEEGRCVHEQVIRRGYNSDIYVGSGLIDMYAKCGSIEDARRVFVMMSTRDLVAWNAMIGAYAMHGSPKEAIRVYESMSKGGLKRDGVTFTCLLSACSHGGLVKEGLRYFKSMSSCWDVLPTMKHFVCMIDILGRAGWLVEAEELMKGLPLETDYACVWRSLLGACRIHGNSEMAERAAKRCWELDPENSSAHVLLSNTYAAA